MDFTIVAKSYSANQVEFFREKLSHSWPSRAVSFRSSFQVELQALVVTYMTVLLN